MTAPVPVVIGDRTYQVAVPYKLRQLEEAAPHLDAINAGAQAKDTSVVGMSTNLRHMLAALLPGIRKLDEKVDLDTLIDEFDPADWEALRGAFGAIFRKSGFNEGEAKAAAPAAPAAA